MRSHKFIRSALWLFVLGFGGNSAYADGWTDQLFDTLSHDFGNIARGKVKKAFTITNKLNKPLHIASATPSCGVCTIAKPDREWLEPGESTVLEAVLDAHKFQRSKDVTITVVFDKPQYGSTRLTLKCFARTDIVLDPGDISLGTIKRGTSTTQTMTIKYAGSPDWKIASVTCTNPAVETEIEETHRGGGRVEYVLKATLKSDSPAGSFRDRILLGINDAYNKSIEVALQGSVQSDVSISPGSISFGSVATDGNLPPKQVLLRGVREFKILSIEGNGGPFEIEKPEDSKKTHVLSVILKPDQKPGEVSQEFQIATDMDGEAPLKLSVTAKLN